MPPSLRPPPDDHLRHCLLGHPRATRPSAAASRPRSVASISSLLRSNSCSSDHDTIAQIRRFQLTRPPRPPSAMEARRQMKNWGTSAVKQRELSKMLDEWAVYIRRKCGNKTLSSSTYLSEAEPFLEQYAKRSVENWALVGAAGNLISFENFLAIIEGYRDEEGDLHPVAETASPTPSILDKVPKHEGLIVFFPGCAKSTL